MKEIKDLYDKNKNLMDKRYYNEKNFRKCKHTYIVTIFILNNNQKILIEKRSKEKGGKYGFISGHLMEKEKNTKGIIREVKEEIGTKIKSSEIHLFHTEKIKNTSYDFFYLKKDIDISKLTLKKDEVEDVKWFSVFEIEKLIVEKNFFENHVEAFEIINKYMKNIYKK